RKRQAHHYPPGAMGMHLVPRRRDPRLPERQSRARLFPGHAGARQTRDHGLRRRGALQAARRASQGGVTASGSPHASSAGRGGASIDSVEIDMRAVLLAVTLALALAAAAPAQAQEAWPQRPVIIIVPFAAGGSADLLARILQQHLQAKFVTPFVVENKSGAGGSIGTGFAAKAPAAGYTPPVGTGGPVRIKALPPPTPHFHSP